MSSIIALILAFQVGYSTTPTTEPTTNPESQPAAQPSAQPASPRGSVAATDSHRLGFELPAVYSHNYATKYFGLDDGPPPRAVYVPVQPSYQPSYYPGY